MNMNRTSEFSPSFANMATPWTSARTDAPAHCAPRVLIASRVGQSQEGPTRCWCTALLTVGPQPRSGRSGFDSRTSTSTLNRHDALAAGTGVALRRSFDSTLHAGSADVAAQARCRESRGV